MRNPRTTQTPGRHSGFTLVELMVVVGIVGVLASIAIPNFIKFATRSRISEAKMMLKAIATAQAAAFNEHDSYSDNFRILQWAPNGEPRFLYGFQSDAFPEASGCNDTAECGGGFTRSQMKDIFAVPLTSADLPNTAVVTQEGFTVGAVGNVDNDATLDTWTLDDANRLTNVTSDLDE